MPAFLLGFSADARPTVFLISQEVFGTFDISNDISTSGFESLSTGHHSPLNINGTLDFKLNRALLGGRPGGDWELDLGLGLGCGIEEGHCGQGGGQDCCGFAHRGPVVGINIRRCVADTVFENNINNININLINLLMTF